jgi:molecular chaperone HtpG
MALIPSPPNHTKDTEVYKFLRAKSQPEDGLAERTEAFISAATPLLELIIAGPFKEYTLHNPAHAKKLVHLAGQIIPAATLDKLSALELTVIIMSSYLHDLGMCLTSTERQRIIISTEFEETFRGWPELWEQLTDTREQLKIATESERLDLEARIFQLQEAALTAYLRPRHATKERYEALTNQLKQATGRSDLFSIRSISFEDELIDVCISHNLDVGILMESRDTYTYRFPRDLPVGNMRLNMQFCAAVLRIVDVLDFDRERTPRVLFDSLSIETRDLPGASASLKEWNKHMAVHAIDLRKDELVISGDSHHPSIEQSIREFCRIIEREIRDTLSVLRRNEPAILEAYSLELPLNVRSQIRALGYTYKDLAFRLNESAIVTLLMGERLYTNRAVALRELIQNSIDACRARKVLDPSPAYVPYITLHSTTDEHQRSWIEIEDNGIGMDEYVLSNFFFKIGNSYYGSPEFQRTVRQGNALFSPISRFGIGILSVFMIGDLLELVTKNQFSPRADHTMRTLRVEGRAGLAFVKEQPGNKQGTSIRIRLRKDIDSPGLFYSQAIQYLRETLVRPEIPVSVTLGSESLTAKPHTYTSLRETASEKLHPRDVEAVVIDVHRWSDRLTGKAILFFHKDQSGNLSHAKTQDERLIPLDVNDFIGILHGFKGNRLTVNGLTMNIKRLGRILGHSGSTSRIAAALDIDIRGDADVSYDVARNRLVGTGANVVARELHRTIISGIKDLGVYDRLDEKTKLILNRRVSLDRNFKPVEDTKILNMVEKSIPQGIWPQGLHRQVAESLGITTNLAYRAISTLIAIGRIVKPTTNSTT